MRQFARGERAKLSELAAIHHLWDVELSLQAPVYVVDYCCFGLDENGEVIDDDFVINFNRPDAPNGAIQLNNTANNGAVFSLALELLPPRVRRLVFTASLGETPVSDGLKSLQGGLVGGLVGAAFSLFGVDAEVGSGYLILATPAAEMAFFEFNGGDFGESRTLILGEIYLRDEWRFVAAGQPLRGELGAFLRTLSDGPTPHSRAVALVKPGAATPPSAPLRPAKPATPPPIRSAPRPAAPVLAPARAPIPAPVTSPPFQHPNSAIQQPNSTIQQPNSAIQQPNSVDLQQNISDLQQNSAIRQPNISGREANNSIREVQSSNLPVPPGEMARVAPPLNLPQSVPRGGKLQDLIDAAAPGSTLILQRGEYAGPITLAKPLALEAQGSAIWAKNGPVVTLADAGATLHDLDIEVTAPDDENGGNAVALRVESGANAGAPLELDNLNLRGKIAGLGASDGAWKLPRTLDLGEFAARQANDFRFSIEVPAAASLNCSVGGIEVSPREIEAGTHQITLQIGDMAPDTLVVGQLEVRTRELVFIVPLRGSAQSGVEAARGREIGN